MEETVRNLAMMIFKAHCFSWGFCGCLLLVFLVEFWKTGNQTTLLCAVVCGFVVTGCSPMRYTKAPKEEE